MRSIASVFHVSPLARITAGGPDSQVFGRPGAAARAQLEVAPGPAPGRVVPGQLVLMPSLPSPQRKGDAAGPVVKGGVRSLKEWNGEADALAMAELRRQAALKMNGAVGQQVGGLDWYRSWPYSVNGRRGTFRVDS